MKKKLAALTIAAVMGLTPLTAFAAAIDESRYEIALSQGINFKKLSTFYEWGVQQVNILELDMKNPAVKLDVLFNKNGFIQRSTLSSMVNQDSNVIAAVNGDFFSMSNPAFSLGPIVKDGKQLSNPHYELNKYASLMVDSAGSPIMAYLYPGVSVKNSSRNVPIDIAAINKPSKDYANPVIYTSEYMANTPGSTSTYFDLTEVIVENNVVKEVRYGMPSTPIPQNGYAILACGANSFLLQGAFAVGEKVELNTDISLKYPNVKTAVGGGTMLIKDGQDTTISQSVSGKSQRTAIGVTPDQKILIVTVDGRKAPFIGMDEKDMQAYMKSLGAKDAMMLDGGGSTQMMVDGKIQNYMVASERPIVNGLAIKNTAQKGAINNIEIKALKDIAFTGDRIELIIKGFDQSKNPIDVTTPSFQVSSEGFSGSFDGRYFIPSSAGAGFITASYGGVSAKIPFEVLKKNAADPKFSAQPGANPTASVFGNMATADTIIDQAIKAKTQQSVQSSQAVVTIGNSDASFEGGISAPKEAFNGAYKFKTVGDTTFISVDNRNGGVYKVKGQWDYLKGLINTGGSNVVITLQGSDKSGDEIDQTAFDKIIQSAAKTKNIYVVYKDTKFSSRADGNVSYIGIADYKDMGKANLYTDIKYLEFQQSGSQLLYSFKSVFTK